MFQTRVTSLACRRRLWLTLICVTFMLMGYTGVLMVRSSYELTYRNTAHRDFNVQGEALNEMEAANARGPPADPLVVLLLSSMPRGGSTLLTDMLSNIQDSVVMFEPLWLIEKTECYKNTDVACVQKYLSDVFSCTFSEDFENWLKGKGLFFQYFNSQARYCYRQKKKTKETCLKEMNLRALCAATPVLVVKVVRARLAWMHNMLEDSLINLKVIHLTRDPRGSLRSINKFGWDSDPHSRCLELEDDILTYEKMRQAFPSKVMQVQHERLCLKPEDTSRDIFHFLFDNATLPSAVNTFIEKHLLSGTSNKGSMSTFKNSSEEFQAWRFKINDKYLRAIEAEPSCLRSIQHMGHAVFGSEAVAKNNSLPLIINTT